MAAPDGAERREGSVILDDAELEPRIGLKEAEGRQYGLWSQEWTLSIEHPGFQSRCPCVRAPERFRGARLLVGLLEIVRRWGNMR
jgi:hypothetical protein